MLFSSDLSWGEHIRSIASRGYQTIGLLRRAFPASTPVRTKKLLFLSLVLPKLTYCSPILRPNLIKDILLLESVQRRATKFILNDYSSDYKTRLTSLKLLPLMYRLELNDIMFLSHLLRTPPRTSIFLIIFPSATILSLLNLLPHLSCNTLPLLNCVTHFFIAYQSFGMLSL